uniref:Uncharacterized protein n=1 Tax=Thermogladius calderae TaxID=1200300 RepID=A0A7J3XZ43_9CREN
MLTPRDESIVKRAVEIVENANKKNLVLRIIGAIAVYLHIQDNPIALGFYTSQSRLGSANMFTDIDLIAYSKQRKQLMKFFEEELKLRSNPRLNVIFGGRRLFYEDTSINVKIDVFFDKLEFSHDVFFGKEPSKGRLELDYPTITSTDLLLEKLQIHNINYKDIIDIIALLIAHNIALEEVKNSINANYIAQLLSDDWGFWYDAITNLNKVVEIVQDLAYKEKIKQDIRDMVINNINKLIEVINKTPKTKNWEKRAKIGTAKPWYREVEEVF